MWRDALRRATRSVAPPLAASAAAIAAQSHVHAQEAKQPVRQRTAADPEEDRFFAVSSNGWMLQCDDGGHLVTCFPNYVPAARDLRQNFSLREGDIVIATYPKCAHPPVKRHRPVRPPTTSSFTHCPVGAARRGRSRW